MVCDALDEVFGEFSVVVEGHEHGPPVRVDAILVGSCTSRIFHLFVRVAERESNQLFVVPLAVSLELSLSLLKLIACLLLDTRLHLFVDLRSKELIEVSATHRARHAQLNDALGALEADSVFAREEHWLRTELEVNRAFIVVHAFKLFLRRWLSYS